MIKSKNKAFTLVELIIVITILSILATLGFVSFQGYTKDARNSTKITTLKNLENGLNGFQTKSGILPPPDNSKTIQTGSLWQAGVLGDTATKLIGVNKKPTDPETGVEYTYSTYGKTYEIATAVSKSSSVGYTNTTYAGSEELKAKIEGSFNGYVVKYSSGGLNYYMTTPSITLSNPNVNLSVGVSTTGVVINGGNNLPYTYAGVATNKLQNTTLFTPSILYAGASCGPETYEEIIGLVDNLILSLSGSTIDMTELNALKTNTDKLNFGLKLVNQAGGCDIKEPVIADIYPTSCSGKDGTFEGYSSGETLSSNCMFNYAGAGSAIIRGDQGFGNTKGLNLFIGNGEGTLSYKVMLNKDARINFHIKNQLDYGSYVIFYINDIEYVSYDYTSSTNNTYTTFSSPTLSAGSYTFKWRFYRNPSYQGNTILDNINFSCIGGGTGCGINDFNPNNSFEVGDISLQKLFTFTGSITTPWNIVSGAGKVTNGTYALGTPKLKDGTNAYMILNKTFTTPQKIAFDFKSTMDYGSYFIFYINNIEYASYDYTSSTNNIYSTFESPLLPAGNYDFKWRIYKNSYYQANVYIDNLQFKCIGGGVGCGFNSFVTSNGFEIGDLAPWDIFTFTGSIKYPWKTITGATKVSEGTYALTNPAIPDGTNGIVILKSTLASSQRFNFDIKTDLDYGSYVKFYIDGVEYANYDYTMSSNTAYVTYTSALISAGNHEFKWMLYKNWNYKGNMFLDNLRLTP